MSRDEAVAELAEPIVADPQILALVKKRLGLDDADLASIMAAPHRHYSDYPTYKATFERLRPLFWLLYRANRVPKSFYVKFTRPDPGVPQRESSTDAQPAVPRRASAPWPD
jgi:hypothetical protein